MMKDNNYFILNNNVYVPSVGFGTYLLDSGEEAYNTVRNAIDAGYRHIDCASTYKNEVDVGKALKECGIKRSDVFITSKIWNDCETYDDTIKAFNRSCCDLQTDYLDLYLIHFPNPLAFRDHYIERNLNLYKAMEDLYKKGKLRAIGVSNCEVHHLEELKDHIEIPVMVNQIEFHPYYFNKDVYEYAKKENIQLEAHSTLGRGKILEDALLNEIAVKYSKTVSQLCGRYALEHNAVALMKSKNIERMKQNLDIFDFEVSQDDIEKLDSLVKRENKIGSWPDKATY